MRRLDSSAASGPELMHLQPAKAIPDTSIAFGELRASLFNENLNVFVHASFRL